MIYVCSDIHGCLHSFLTMLIEIDFKDEDTMYILGDIFDRGPTPVDLLLYVMSKPNIKMLVGNHEDMAIKALESGDYTEWFLKGGKTTYDQLMQLPKAIQKSIIEYIKKQPIIIPHLNVDGKKFYLAHASHLDEPIDDVLIYHKASTRQKNIALWDRRYSGSKPYKPTINEKKLYKKYKDHTLVIGHTPTVFCNYGKTKDGFPLISKGYNDHLINLDCGACFGGQLGCMRLNDLKEFYTLKKM